MTGRPVKYHFSKLAVGDTLDVPLAGYRCSDGCDMAVKRLRRCADQYAEKYGGKFIVRTIRAEGVGRCTRVA